MTIAKNTNRAKQAMKKLHRTTLTVESGYSQIAGNPAHAVMLMLNSRPTKCGRCGRGVIMRWPWGEEPQISDCKICGAKTTFELRERVWFK